MGTKWSVNDPANWAEILGLVLVWLEAEVLIRNQGSHYLAYEVRVRTGGCGICLMDSWEC